MISDIQKLDDFMRTRNHYTSVYHAYDKVYTFTTENQKGYMTDSLGEDVLSVAGSGDQYLNLALLGARSIDSFDINKFALYHLKIKKAALMTLSKEEFYDFLGCDAKKYYEKIRRHLDYDSLSFWNYYMKNYVTGGFHRSYLFLACYLSSRVFINNIYLMNDNYLSLQKKLLSHSNERCYHSDIYDLPNRLDKEYDSIYLSNIFDYQKDKMKYMDLVSTLYQNHLKKNGKIYYSYSYGKHLNSLDILPNSSEIEIENAKGILDYRDYVYILKKN